MKAAKRTADELLGMLQAQHVKDVFVDECKTGPGGTRRLDAWALVKTWSPPTTIGYEIKVDRHDFTADQKWPDYLDVCHEFYFVAPAGLIGKDELPEGVGLKLASGSRLITKKKAARRAPNPHKLATLMQYVLMSRVRIVANMWDADLPGERSVDRYRRMLLNDKLERQLIGHMLSRRLGEVLAEARRAQARAEEKTARLEHVERKLAELGLDDKLDAHSLEMRLAPIETAMRHLRGQVTRYAKALLEAAKE